MFSPLHLNNDQSLIWDVESGPFSGIYIDAHELEPHASKPPVIRQRLLGLGWGLRIVVPVQILTRECLSFVGKSHTSFLSAQISTARSELEKNCPVIFFNNFFPPKIISCFHKSNSGLRMNFYLVELTQLGPRSKPACFLTNTFVKEANPPHFCLNQDSFRWEKESGLYSFFSHFNYLRILKRSRRGIW